MKNHLAVAVAWLVASISDFFLVPMHPHSHEASTTLAWQVGSPFYRYNNSPRVAVRLVPLYEAEILAEVEIRTMDVFTVKLTLVAPGGTVTLAGTLAAVLLLESRT